MESTDGAMGDNATDTGNSTETSLCSMDKKPEITQECGASAKEEEDAEPTEEKAEEVSYTMHYVEQWFDKCICIYLQKYSIITYTMNITIDL